MVEVHDPPRVPAVKPFSDAFVTCKPNMSARAASPTSRPARASADPLLPPRADAPGDLGGGRRHVREVGGPRVTKPGSFRLPCRRRISARIAKPVE
jgi:hypothetical protein